MTRINMTKNIQESENNFILSMIRNRILIIKEYLEMLNQTAQLDIFGVSPTFT